MRIFLLLLLLRGFFMRRSDEGRYFSTGEGGIFREDVQISRVFEFPIANSPLSFWFFRCGSRKQRFHFDSFACSIENCRQILSHHFRWGHRRHCSSMKIFNSRRFL